MKVKVIFKELNPNYDQDYADRYHFGEESENNRKVEWSSTFSVLNVNSIRVGRSQNKDVIYGMKNEFQMTKRISDMSILGLFSADENCVAEFGVSNSLIERIHKVKAGSYDVTRYYFYLKPLEPRIHLGDYYIVSEADLGDAIRILKDD